MKCTVSQRRHIIILLFVIPFLMGIGIDLYAPSLPIISKHFQVHTSLAQLTIGLYMLGYAVGQIFLGVLSDSLGRRKILLCSGLFYVIFSFLSALSPNIYILILCRFLQGIGIAGLGVVARAIATDCFFGLDLTKALTCFSISWATGPILGPFIGGYLQHFFNWQADFYFFCIYGLIAFIYAFLTIPETHLDLLPLNPAKLYGTIKMVITHPIFLLGSILASLVYATLVVFNIVGPFLIQVVLKYSVIDYGHIALLLGIGYFLGNLFNRFMINYFKPMSVSLCGIVGALAMSLIIIILGVLIKMNLIIILIPIFLLFFVCGLILPNMIARCVGLFPKLGGTANAIVGSLTAGGVFLMTLVATSLKTHTQMPMAVMYVTMFCICLILFFICKKFTKQII